MADLPTGSKVYREGVLLTPLTALEQRRGYFRAVVAIAAKNARLAWALPAKGEHFKQPAAA